MATQVKSEGSDLFFQNIVEKCVGWEGKSTPGSRSTMETLKNILVTFGRKKGSYNMSVRLKIKPLNVLFLLKNIISPVNWCIDRSLLIKQPKSIQTIVNIIYTGLKSTHCQSKMATTKYSFFCIFD